MDYSTKQYDRLVKTYDPKLFCIKDDRGIYHVMRKKSVYESVKFQESRIVYAREINDHILSLTVDGQPLSEPKNIGLVPLWYKLNEMDQWREDYYQEMCFKRDDAERWRKRTNRNELRARAADMRREFAQGFNEFNTSTLSMKQERRKKL